MEVWLPCADFPKYMISPEGVLRKRSTDAIVHTRQNKQGIVMVNLDGPTRRQTKSLALLVAKAYLEPPRNEAYNSIIHLDGDKANCHASNLMWRPRWYALLYFRMFKEEPIHISVKNEETGEVFGTLRDACMKYGLYERYTYMDLLNGDPCFHYGYRLVRANEY